METWLKLILSVYLIAFLGTAVVWRSNRVWRRTGINPFALGRGDSAHDFIGKLFRVTTLATAAAVLVYALIPQGAYWLVPITWLAHPALVAGGLVLLAGALAWVMVAQAQMGASWRIGIDTQTKTALVQTGLYAVSRNPIFLGMLAMQVGLVLVLPTAVTLTIAVVGATLIHIQVRLEEEHLARTHGAPYHAYRQKVRRWL